MEDITHPDDLAPNGWLRDTAIACGSSFDIQKRYMLPDGEVRWVENRVTCHKAPGGDLLGVISRAIRSPRARCSASDDLREYLSDMSAQLGLLASDAGLTSTADALLISSHLSSLEKNP